MVKANYRIPIVIGTLVLLAASQACAQNPGEVFIRQANVEHNEAVLKFTGDFTAAFPGQAGFDSFDEFETEKSMAIVNQIGDGNISTTTQNGSGNGIRLNIFGNNNTTAVQQNGRDNLFILNLEGSDSFIEGSQRGNGNQLRLDLAGSFPDQAFTQSGRNLSLQLFDAGNGGGIPMQIRQRGNGASVIIENY